jgi:aminomethyltransferase
LRHLHKIVQLQNFHAKNGHLTEFAGFLLPIWFKGIIPESLAVRNAAGIFDVSHMGRAIIAGKKSQQLLDRVTTNDVAALEYGQGQYSLICNQEGGIKDDVLVFHLQREEYLLVYNADNRQRDYDWLIANSHGLEVEIDDVSDRVAMFAVQGPMARDVVQHLSTDNLLSIPRFGCSWTRLAGFKTLISRTGYTGEDGFEVLVWDSPLSEPANAEAVWNKLLETGKTSGLEPCGLGARDLLRLEAGLCLYGTDMDEDTNPYEARLGFVVKLHKGFIGRDKLREIKETESSRIRVGMIMERRVIPRHGFPIFHQERDVGAVTSGSFSPILNIGIAMGYVERDAAVDGAKLDIQVRDRREKAKVVKPPFYDPTRYGYLRKT